MDLSLNEEQEMLKTMARDFLNTECPKTLVKEMAKDERGCPPDLWKKMANLGWMGLAFPEKYGGTGNSFLDLTVLMEEMGRACLPGAFFSTIVLGGLTILEAGSDEQKQDLLSGITKGELIVTLALTEPSAKYTPDGINVKATQDKDDYIITGTKLFVPDAHIANYLICVARTQEAKDPIDGITLFLVDTKSPGVSCSLLTTIAGDKQCEVVLDKVRVPAKNILGKKDEGWTYIQQILQKADVALCAQMVGGAQQVLEMSVDYAKERKQFGKPIGSFQAIQHHCANMATDVDGSRFITYQAAWMLSENLPCVKEVSMAKAWCSEAFRKATSLGQQIHGGIGFIEDHDMPLYFKRAKSWELTLGDAHFHHEIVATEMGL
ncbi:MAG: acyl-CoA dehydrogenase family protein [Chloroflexota bacterium]|nr:acyl-CoA dehydrogenase family protein [Chloroflexota bacterium]